MTHHGLDDLVEQAQHPLWHGGPLNGGDALWAVGEVQRLVQVVGQLPHDLAEGQGDDCQVVAADPEHRQAKDQTKNRGDDHTQEYEQVEIVRCQEERRVQCLGGDRGMEQVGLLGSEECPQIGAHRVEGHVAEIEQAGETHHDIEAQGQGGEHRDLEDDLQIEHVPGAQDGHQDHREEDRQAELDGLVHLEPVDGAGGEHEHQEAGDGAGA